MRPLSALMLMMRRVITVTDKISLTFAMITDIARAALLLHCRAYSALIGSTRCDFNRCKTDFSPVDLIDYVSDFIF
jgi:hypothetical protein